MLASLAGFATRSVPLPEVIRSTTMYTGLFSSRRVLFSAGVLTLCIVYVVTISRSFLAYRNAQQLDVDHLRKATQLAPLNATYWNRLGRLLAFAQQEFGASIPPLETATRLSPYSAAYRIDLASA